MEFSLSIGSHGGLRIRAATASPHHDMELSGVSLHVQSGGMLRVALDRLQCRHLRLQSDAGAASVAKLTLVGAAFTIAPSAVDRSWRLQTLGADELQLEGVDIAVSVAAPGTRAAPAGAWRLDALGGLDGMLQAFITDAAWVVDAEVGVPVAGGRIDFDRIVVEHIGPNSSMGISRNSIHVDSPNLGRKDLLVFTVPQVPGATVETRGGNGRRVTARGSLELQPFMQALLGGRAPIMRAAGPDVEGTLDRTRLNGELRPGDGALGTERQHVVLEGRSLGKNRIALAAAVVGQRLVLRVPQFLASGAVFDVLGQRARTDQIAAKLELHITGLRRPPGAARAGPAVALTFESLSVRRVRVGIDDAAAETPAAAPMPAR